MYLFYDAKIITKRTKNNAIPSVFTTNYTRHSHNWQPTKLNIAATIPLRGFCTDIYD